MNEELERKIKGLSQDELLAYNNAATLASRIISVLGVGIILMVLNFANFFTIIAGSVGVYLLSNVSVALGNTRRYIRERMKTFKKNG